MNKFYAINLLKKSRIFQLDASELDDICEELKCDALSLSNYDAKIFKTEKQAEAWLKKFKFAETMLELLSCSTVKPKTSILYKRHYLVQTIMGEKNNTVRDSPRTQKLMSKVEIGERFRLHDQKYFVDVILTGKTKQGPSIRYDFELA